MSRIGTLSHVLSPGYSWCFKCKTTWKFVEGHSTPYVDHASGYGKACFPLCEECWAELTPEERWPYYQMLLDSWRSLACPIEPGLDDQLHAAVMDGK